MKHDLRPIVSASVLSLFCGHVYAQDAGQTSNVEIAPVVVDVISVTPALGVGLPWAHSRAGAAAHAPQARSAAPCSAAVMV